MIPTFQPRKPFHRRGSHAPAQSSPPTAIVTEVIVVGPTQLLWRFSMPFAFDGAECPQLEGNDSTAWFVPVWVGAINSTELVAEYEGASFSDENPSASSYRVLATPAGMTFSGGVVLAIPQAGTCS